MKNVFHWNGASNNTNTGAGEVGTDPSIPFAYYTYGRPAGESSGDLFVDMVGNTATTGGYIYTVARLLKAGGMGNQRHIAITQGSSFYNDWDPVSIEGVDMLSHLATMLANLKALDPTETRWRHWFIRNQGTSDMRNASLQFQSGQPQGTIIGPYTVTEGTSFPGWDGGNTLWFNAYVAAIAAAGLGSNVRKKAIQQFTGMSLQTYPAVPVVPRRQIVWVGGTPDPDTTKVGTHSDLVPLENADAYEADGVHGKKTPVTIGGVLYSGGGYEWMAYQIAPNILRDYYMGNIGPQICTAWVNHVRNKAAYSPAANHYAHLYSDAALTVPLTAGNASGYVAATKANNTVTYAAPSARAVTNLEAFNFPAPSGAWPQVWGYKLTDSPTEGSGTVLHRHVMASPISPTVATGPVSIAAGTMIISAPTNVGVGGFSDAVVHGLLGLTYGGTAFAPAWATTDYGSHWAGDPAGAGAQAGSRVAITQATTWGAASGGQAVTAAAVSLAQQATGTYWAEHDAAAAGNLLFTATRPASVGATGTILAGQVQTTIT